VHAQCWSHTRRQFLKAEAIEPQLTETALVYIRRLYEAEALLKPKLTEDVKRMELRAERCKPIVDEFFEWLKTTLEQRVLLPSNPFTEAAGYALAREGPLRVFLEYPDVPIDTNHLEREIRPIALGRKNWLFCWTEVGAKYVGIFQSLLVTCRLQGVDPYTYLVDVLQRVEIHPASDVASLTPRLWKERFAANPLRSVIDRPVKNVVA
jgi:transposase